MDGLGVGKLAQGGLGVMGVLERLQQPLVFRLASHSSPSSSHSSPSSHGTTRLARARQASVWHEAATRHTKEGRHLELIDLHLERLDVCSHPTARRARVCGGRARGGCVCGAKSEARKERSGRVGSMTSRGRRGGRREAWELGTRSSSPGVEAVPPPGGGGRDGRAAKQRRVRVAHPAGSCA